MAQVFTARDVLSGKAQLGHSVMNIDTVGAAEKLDTRKPTSKLMLTILAGVATWEREIMLERQREGIAVNSLAILTP